MVQKRLCFLLTSLLLLVGMAAFADDNSGTTNEEGSESEDPTGGYTFDDEVKNLTSGYFYKMKGDESGGWLQAERHRALVGYGCEVNKIVNVIQVGGWTADLNNIVDTDIDNKASFPAIADASLASKPLVSVRDMKRTYRKGCKAGFIITSSSSSSLLSLDVLKFFAIYFYKDGELVGSRLVKNGSDFELIGLRVLQFSTEEVNMELAVEAPDDFDEVALVPSSGVNLDVIGELSVRYAFVGIRKRYDITQTQMEQYMYDNGRTATKYFDYGQYVNGIYKEFTTSEEKTVLVQGAMDATDGVGSTLSKHSWDIDSKLVDGDPKSGEAISAVLAIGTTNHACVWVNPADWESEGVNEAFPAGTEIAFHYSSGSVLNLDIVKDPHIKLRYNDGTLQKDYPLSVNVIGLGLVEANTGSTIAVRAEAPFSRASMFFTAGLDLQLGATLVNYAYVLVPPEIDEHHDFNIGYTYLPCEDIYRLYALEGSVEVVSWECTKHPEGVSPTISGSDGLWTISNYKDGEGNIVAGEYEFTATDTDGCQETVKIFIGNVSDKLYAKSCALVNETDETYVASNFTNDSNGGLIVTQSNCDGVRNLVNNDTDDFAQLIPGINVAQNTMICGVKLKDPDGVITPANGQTVKRIGFIIETRTSALDLNLLDFFCIKAFDAHDNLIEGIDNAVDGVGKATDEFTVLSTGLIGKNKVQKERLSIPVSAENAEKIHRIELWRCGVAEVNFNRLKIYYAFADTDDTPYDFVGMNVLSYKDGATLKAMTNQNDTQVSAVSLAKVTDNLTFLIDEDNELQTAALIGNTVSLAGNKIVINLGRTYQRGTQVGIVIENDTHLANISLGNWVTLAAYRNDVSTDSETGETTINSVMVTERNDWDVLSADVIGGGDKRLLYLTPTGQFDELQVTFAGIVEALDYIKVYGVFVRSDVDEDGIPDAIDPESCSVAEELLLNEEWTALNKKREYTNAMLVLHRNFNISPYKMVQKLDNDNNPVSAGGEPVMEYEMDQATGEPVLVNKNLWNSLVLPVNLTGEQLRNAFGESVRLAEAIGLNAEHHNIIRFELVNIPAAEEKGEPALKAGHFYLIKIQRQPEWVLADDEGTGVAEPDFYESTDPAEAESEYRFIRKGDIYFIPNVNYLDYNEDGYGFEDQKPNFKPTAEANQGVIFKGLYAISDENDFPARSYAFYDGNMYKTTQKGNMKGFRFWIEDEETASARNFTFTVEEDGVINGIFYVTDDGGILEGDDYIYDISGRRIGHGDRFHHLETGIYIVKGKKVFVKH